MKRYLIIFLLVMVGEIPAIAQNDNSFESFRKGIKEGFNTFRKKVLDDYDKYLEGVWTEYNAFRGEERYPLPKPTRAPVAETAPGPPITQTPIVSKPQPELLPSDKKPQRSEPLVEPVIPVQNWNSFSFYSILAKVPKVELENNSRVLRSQNFAALWRIYSDSRIAHKVIPVLKQYATACNLNDWFIFELVRSYVDNIFSTAEPQIRISLMHHLLNHWGYDVRVGMEKTGQPILLVAIQQMVYARTYTSINGQRYYLFYDSRSDAARSQNSTFTTCDLPKDADKGCALDLVIYEELNVPYLSYSYVFSYGSVEIKGEVNANLMPMLYHYPQVSMDCYVRSVVNKSVHEEIVKQLRLQLTGMSQHKAVDTLLQFVQNAFEYATDGELHGFEKPYFFEEILFYPQCDCEDRSIFYSSLLWHVLGVENQLIGYPGHEAVAVHLDVPINGDGYLYKNRHFYISDPTYIGAITGMCMPDYRNTPPEIDFSWQISN